MNKSSARPKRAEVWRVDYSPTIGAEISKIRPAVVISSDAAGRLPLKLIAPITGWDSSYSSAFWHVRIDPDSNNGLAKPSSVDTMQMRGMDLQRFIAKLGVLPADKMEEITTTISILIEHQ